VTNIVEAMQDPDLFGPWFSGPSWNAWKAVLKAAFALPMTAEELIKRAGSGNLDRTISGFFA
jgi:hypothetical protein